MKVLSIDYGERRIGLAISDEMGIIAKAMPPLNVTSLADSISKLHRIANSQNIDRIVIGLPLGQKNEETKQSIQTRYFANAFKSTNGVEVEFWNESFSTLEAQGNIKAGPKKRKKKIDSEAARVILQEYLDSKEESPTAPTLIPQYNSLTRQY
jgi:putative Holliday junction resolvase